MEVLVTNAQNIDRMALDIHPGTFVFEILADLCVAHTSSILTVDGRTLALDQRVWYDMTIIVTGTHTANGTLNETIWSLPVGGLRDLRLEENPATIPAKFATLWFLFQSQISCMSAWAPAMLHGTTYFAIAINRHWILLECQVYTSLLQVIYWDTPKSSKSSSSSFVASLDFPHIA